MTVAVIELEPVSVDKVRIELDRVPLKDWPDCMSSSGEPGTWCSGNCYFLRESYSHVSGEHAYCSIGKGTGYNRCSIPTPDCPAVQLGNGYFQFVLSKIRDLVPPMESIMTIVGCARCEHMYRTDAGYCNSINAIRELGNARKIGKAIGAIHGILTIL